MIATRIASVGFAAVTLLSACQFHARGPEKYRMATRELVETRSAQIQVCYEEVLKKTPDAGGTVVIKFNVMPKTGAVESTEILQESTAPADLSQCVVKALEGLVLNPPDERQGEATFSWTFEKQAG